MAKILRANGDREDIEPMGENGKLTLEQLQKVVGGWVEVVVVPDCHNLLIVDEDGKLKNLPVNVTASKVAQTVIVGDVVLCSIVEVSNTNDIE